MGKRASKKGSASGCQEDSKSRNSQTELFAGPSVTDATLQQSVLDLLRGIYDEGSGDLRSSVHRNKVSQAIRDRMDKMQGEIQIHSDSRDSVVDILYTMFKLLQAQWKKQGPSKSSKQPEPPAPSENPKPATQLENTQPPGSTFDQTGLSVVPDADVQIITHDNPGQPLPVRLSDLLPDSNDLTHRTLNGGWLGTPQEGETRLTSINPGSTVIRVITTYYPSHRNPSPDNVDGNPRSPLPRPSFKIIIRPQAISGGALVSQQPELARPGTTRRGSLDTSPGRSRLPPRTATGDPGARPTISEVPGPQRDTPKRPLPASVTTEPPVPSTSAGPTVPSVPPPVARRIPRKRPMAASVQNAPGFDLTIPQSAIDALNAPGPGSGWFEYDGLVIVPRRSPAPETTQPAALPTAQPTAQPTVQSTANPGDRRRREIDDEPSDRPTQRRRLSDQGSSRPDPSKESTDISMFDASSLPDTIGLAETRRLNWAAQPATWHSNVAECASKNAPTCEEYAADILRWKVAHRSSQDSSAVGQYIPPVAELINEVVPSAGPDLYEQVGEPWLGMSERRMPPGVQGAIASRRFSAEITQGTEQIALTGEPEQPFASRVPLTVTSVPTGPVPAVPRSADDRISAVRKPRRRFSEHQRRPNDSSSSDSQVSSRKKRRLNMSPASSSPSPPKGKTTKFHVCRPGLGQCGRHVKGGGASFYYSAITIDSFITTCNPGTTI
ncbi:uncharacterized protein N7473_011233 [Penicillium subrubescens]|uniref:uncharacterized protein n=1 Tax=Penicillium subrubescens TaxID=1316194 RepID=UPI0025450E1F|nr:uncharacterized protein N7473_011233 [Penicillium subrubescens]KAJ5880180.1 hypothetical protein N7473_011233 [Penicillium subrubescens]